MEQDVNSIGYFLKTHGELMFVVLSAFVGLIVWLVRLEGRVNTNVKSIDYVSDSNKNTQRDVDELRIKHEVLDSKIVDQLTALKISVAEIKVFLFKKKDSEE